MALTPPSPLSRGAGEGGAAPAFACLVASIIAAALLTIALLRPAPYAVDVGEPGDAYGLASFHRPEATFRWSAPGSRLLIPATYDGPQTLELRLHAPAFAGDQRIRIERDGALVAVAMATPDWRVYRLLLPPDAAPEQLSVGMEPLDLVAPASYGPGDARPLGVALDEVRVAAVGEREAPILPALARATAVAWGAGLAWAAVALLAGWRHPAATALPMIAAGLGLAAWAWRAPLSFAWSAPAPPWWLLAAGTVMIGAVAAVGRTRAAPRRFSGRAVVMGTMAAGLLALLLPAPWSGAGALLALLLPGALVAWALFPEERSPAARVFLGICGAVAVAALLVLGLQAIPGPLPGWLLVGAACAVAAAALWAWPRGEGPHPPSSPLPLRRRGGGQATLILAALLVGLGLRLWRLGGAEFQGDEARAMLLALGVALGDDGLLLTHTKGPVEALLPAAVLVAAGSRAEWAARLPFALASLGVLAGALALMETWIPADGRRTTDDGRPLHADPPSSVAGGWWSVVHRPSSLVVVSLLAVDGFAVAFGRIVQYQSVVMLMMTGALWCGWRFYAGAVRATRHLAAAAALLAVGMLAHDDAVMVVPALAGLVEAGGRRRGWRGGDWVQWLAAPTLVGAALLASFYLPYVTSASFGQTAEYLAGRAGQGDAGGPPFNNLPLYYSILSFYSAPYLAPALVAAVAGALCALLARYARPRAVGWALAGVLAAATLAQWLAPGAFALPGGGSWAVLAFGLPLAGLCTLPGVPAPARATGIWFAVAFCAEAFLIAEPRTHFYTAHVPAALLVGLAWGTQSAERRAQKPRAELLSAFSFQLSAFPALLLLVGGALYGQIVYLRQLPEYQRWFPAARPAWLAGPYGDALPEAGYFGFPHRDGWKAAAELFRAGELRGSYDSNQNRWLAGWYLAGQAQHCKGQPELYLIAEGEPSVYYPPGYHMVAEVTVGPGRALAVYGREAPAGGPRSYALEDLAAAHDARPAAPFPVAALLNEEPPRCEGGPE